MENNIEYGCVFEKTISAYENGKKVIIHKGGTGCLAGNTLVKTECGYKQIKDIKIGDYVYSIKDDHYKLNKVVNKFRYNPVPTSHNMVIFTLFSNAKIQCTYDHKFRINGKWIKAIDVARRRMENPQSKVCNFINGKISNFWQTFSNSRVKTVINEACLGWHRLFKDGNGWENDKNAQGSSESIHHESRKEKNHKSCKWYKNGQPGREFGMGDASREYKSCNEIQPCCTGERGTKRQFKNNETDSYRNKEFTQKRELDQKTISREIQCKNINDKRYKEWQDLELSLIKNIEYTEYKEPVYDIEVNNYHSYLITEENIVTHNSGKTEDIIIFLIFVIALKQANKIITIVSESHPHLEIGAIRILKKYILKAGLMNVVKINDSVGRCIFPNGSIIEFFSADRIEKALGARRHWLFGNEINSLKEKVWEELARRSEFIIADFNPTVQFWLEDWMQNYNDTVIIKSNYKDNPQLPEHEILRIEKRASRDENFKRIHIDCEYGGYEGIVFPNWRYAQAGEIDQALKDNPSGYALDYGYHPDPDAMVKVAINKQQRKIYAREMIYTCNNGTNDLIRQINQFYRLPELIIAESASPRTNADLSRHFNIQPVSKTKTVSEWLREMQDYEFIIEGINLSKEFNSYIWSDKKAGVPIDGFNHLIDGIRYWYMSQHTRNYF